MDIIKEIIVNKILGISFFNNFLFERNGICVWCVFGVLDLVDFYYIVSLKLYYRKNFD